MIYNASTKSDIEKHVSQFTILIAILEISIFENTITKQIIVVVINKVNINKVNIAETGNQFSVFVSPQNKELIKSSIMLYLT